MANTTGEAGRQEGLTDQASSKVQEATSVAQEKASELREEGSARLRDQVDQRSTQAGQQITTVAGDVRSVADELRSQGKDTPARYAEQAAEKVQSAGQWLENADGDQILRDVEGFARRNPWAVAAGGLVLGLAASRFLKASSSERYRASQANGSGSYGGGTQVGADAPRGTSEFSRQPGPMVSTEPRT
jgi:hypothetical protein